jgi:hypothetical protein
MFAKQGLYDLSVIILFTSLSYTYIFCLKLRSQIMPTSSNQQQNNNIYTSTSVDDSSDEEDNVESYDIKEQFKNYKLANNIDEVSAQNTVLSFISHAAGIYSLYSPKVQKKYYELKKEKLTTELSFKSEEVIQQEIEANCDKIHYFAGRDWRRGEGNNEKMQKVFEIIKTDIYNRIITDKSKYIGAWLKKETVTYLESIFDDKHLNPDDINNFRCNIAYPEPVADFKRKTLGSEPCFDLSAVEQETFVVEFLAYLRLHNKSEKRHLNNKEVYPESIWKFFDTEEAHVKLRNDSNCYYKCSKDTKDYYKYCIRNELVLFSNDRWLSYTEILSNLTEKEQKCLLTNRINIKQGQSYGDLSPDFLSSWYLLFGCEVIKNPAALIQHNMAFDLVESSKLEWGNDMIEIIPMMEKRVTQKAVALNHEYSKYMPHQYLYQIDNNFHGHEDLITKEANIMKSWMELKLGPAVSNYLIKQIATDSDAVQTIWDLVMESFDDWGLQDVSVKADVNTELLGEVDAKIELTGEFESMELD